MFRLRVGEHELIYCQPALLRRMDFTGNFVLFFGHATRIWRL